MADGSLFCGREREEIPEGLWPTLADEYLKRRARWRPKRDWIVRTLKSVFFVLLGRYNMDGGSALDVTRDSFEDVLVLKKKSPSDFSEEAKFKSFVLRNALDKFKGQKRTQSRREQRLRDRCVRRPPAAGETSPVTEAARRELWRAYEAAKAALRDPRWREAWELWFENGRTLEKCQENLKANKLLTVFQWKERARKAIGIYLQQRGHNLQSLNFQVPVPRVIPEGGLS
jgi:DNA-directed RNA polymerase specialized sigma24 family protein